MPHILFMPFGNGYDGLRIKLTVQICMQGRSVKTIMRTLINYIRADFIKMKHLSILVAHIAIPIGTATAFLMYYAYANWDEYSKVATYYQVLGMGFPTLIGLFCAMLAEQELSAGNFQNILSALKRPIAFFSKLLVLILFGMGAVLLASVMFGMGYFFLLGQQYIRYSLYIEAAFMMMGSNIFLYILHMFLALRFNKGVTIGLGVVESLLSALFLTGLGDGIWIFVPAAWANRFITIFLLQRISTYDIINAGSAQPKISYVDLQKLHSSIVTDWKAAIVICAVITVGGISAFGVWACRWDGICGSE